MLNHAEIMGRITHDLELRRTPNNKAVCSFTVAVDRNRKREDGTYDTDWIRVVAWDHTAEFVSRNFEKGKPNGASVPLPRGKIDLVSVFQAFADVGYDGVCSLEYERNFQDNERAVIESIAYERGICDAITTKAQAKSN